MMKFPFRWIPGNRWAKEHGQLFVMTMDSAAVSTKISLDARWHMGSGVVREIIDPRVMHVRHGFCETLDENDKLTPTGPMIYDMASVKKHFMHWRAHKARFEMENPDHMVVAFSSNGNCGSNPYYVACDGKNQLFLNSEIEAFSRKFYSCLVNTGHRGLEIVHSLPLTDQFSVPLASGIPIVRCGRELTKDSLGELILDGKLYDLCHLFLCGYSKYAESWINVGYNAFFTEGKLDLMKVTAGIHGEVLRRVPMGLLSDDQVCESLLAKGYHEVSVPKARRPGQFRVKDGFLDIVFLPGIYSHSMVGITRDGRMISAAIRALSNRAGGTDYLGAALIMAELGCYDALLCDNGGDTVNGLAGGEFFTQTEEPNRGLRSVFLYTVERGARLSPDWLTTTIYPPQYPE